MKIKVIRIIKIEKEIEKCFHTCPYFGLIGHEMICEHPIFDNNPDTYSRCIISHPDCDVGFPKKCPLLKI